MLLPSLVLSLTYNTLYIAYIVLRVLFSVCSYNKQHTHTHTHTQHNTTKTNNTQARDEVVVEPLIVGVLLFVPLLALLPTVAAWHLLAAAAAALAAAVRAALAVAAGLLRLSPVTVLGWRLARPLDFAGVWLLMGFGR